ncbi:hypothetical protein HYALB_00001128 [Hymenoscyphus albidus]|uniref:PLC-like phosphodiesterase n=1 Tax=Hymenoscyphus albidus TaxID=595503 RepID=A0A9N9LC01_9HELO|nr:hypothetical protein HYALB_00001128 [Hymenoscyphus albidus]
MLFLRILPGCIFALLAKAQDEVPEVSDSRTLLSGTGTLREDPIPTGTYLSISTTLTVTSSAITTSAIVSTITSDDSTITTTLGSTTILGIGIPIGSNATVTSTTSDSRTLLSGAPRTSTILNGTAGIIATSSSVAPQPTNITPCNNYPEFCARRYGNITEVAAHNSPFVKAGNAAANQQLGVTAQLNDGIRLLQGQMHFGNDSTPHFCHTSCEILDAGPITTYLTAVKTWVAAHPYDVVTILLGNSGYSAVEKYVPFIESTGILQYAYIPPKIPMGINDWPTLASMILTGKRVVFFLDYEANQGSVPWMLDEFSHMWETPFDPVNRTFPCDIQRPPNLKVEDAKNRLYLVNHNLNYEISILGNSLLVPSIPLLNVTNNVTGFGSLGVSADQCTQQWEQKPKFLNVDYYNVGKGSVFQVAAKLNNVTYNRLCCGLVGRNIAGRMGGNTVLAVLMAIGTAFLMM